MINIKISRLRTVLPQVIASLLSTVLLLDIGVSIAYPTVVISALTGLNNEINPNELLHMTAIQASWMGSIGYLGKLFGSLSCGFANEFLGRRKSMILINIPLLMVFLIFYYSTSIWKVFVANTLLGYGAGFSKAPSSVYVGEISEVSIRGVLVSMVTMAITTGPLITFILGNITKWRNIALFWCVIQIIIMIALHLIPESPIWLISKERDEDALKSLRWLRGWVPQSDIQNEFDSIKRHKKTSDSCESCKNETVECTHVNVNNTQQKMKELIRKRTLKPFTILAIIAAVSIFSGTHHLSAYIVQILNTYRSPISPNLGTIIVGILGVCGTVAGIFGLKLFGKRKLYLIALFGVIVCSMALSIYGFMYLPRNSRSFEQKRLLPQTTDTSSIPLIIFCLMRFFTTITMMIPFALLSELYSMKARSMATGMTTALNDILTFIAIKSFYNLEHSLDLPSSFGIYCAIGAIGFIVLYNILPETEGCKLEDIEIHFSDNSRKLTDRHIIKHSANDSRDKEII